MLLPVMRNGTFSTTTIVRENMVTGCTCVEHTSGHVTGVISASPWKGGMGACATGSRGFLPIIESLDRI
jgi:hypothetical protein